MVWGNHTNHINRFCLVHDQGLWIENNVKVLPQPDLSAHYSFLCAVVSHSPKHAIFPLFLKGELSSHFLTKIVALSHLSEIKKSLIKVVIGTKCIHGRGWSISWVGLLCKRCFVITIFCKWLKSHFSSIFLVQLVNSEKWWTCSICCYFHIMSVCEYRIGTALNHQEQLWWQPGNGERATTTNDVKMEIKSMSLWRLLHYSLNNLTELEVEEMSVAPTAAASVSFSPLITWWRLSIGHEQPTKNCRGRRGQNER